MSIRRVLLLTAMSLVAAGSIAPAMAADLAVKPYVKAQPMMMPALIDWSGFYVGLNAGGGSSHNCFSPGGGDFDLGCHNATGGTVGGQVGYRWQAGTWVFGLEAQGNWADFSGSHDPLAGGHLADTVSIGSHADSFGLFTGQAGYAMSNVLLYVKGGAAVVHNRYNISSGANLAELTPDGTVLATANDTRWGGTVGAGLEYALCPNWSIGIEYDHIFLSGRDLDVRIADAVPHVGGTTFPGAGHVSQGIDMGLVRLNYKFGGPVVARY